MSSAGLRTMGVSVRTQGGPVRVPSLQALLSKGGSRTVWMCVDMCRQDDNVQLGVWLRQYVRVAKVCVWLRQDMCGFWEANKMYNNQLHNALPQAQLNKSYKPYKVT